MNATAALLLAALTTLQSAPAETYASVAIDASGNLRIRTTDQRTIVVPKDGRMNNGTAAGRQTAFEKPVISDDRSAVGAQARFENCCTSYDIPLQLVVYSDGKTHRFQGGLAIFDWHFTDGGRRVAFSQQTVHFGCAVHWELRDVASERLLAQVDLPEPCGQIPNPPNVKAPKWVTSRVSGFK